MRSAEVGKKKVWRWDVEKVGESRAERLELKVTDFGSGNVGCGKFEEGNYSTYAVSYVTKSKITSCFHRRDAKDAEMFFLILCRWYSKNTGGQEGRQRIKEHFFWKYVSELQYNVYISTGDNHPFVAIMALPDKWLCLFDVEKLFKAQDTVSWDTPCFITKAGLATDSFKRKDSKPPHCKPISIFIYSSYSFPSTRPGSTFCHTR